MPGRALGVATSQSCGESPALFYVATTVTQYLFIATIPVICTGFVVRIRVGSTSGTVTLVKCPSGTAPASGTALSLAVDISATPTADTTINVPLIVGNNNANVTLNAGDALGLVFAGTMTSGIGIAQVFIEPVT
jgi:hypothetical protein